LGTDITGDKVVGVETPLKVGNGVLKQEMDVAGKVVDGT
jgi:hypothetical protein